MEQNVVVKEQKLTAPVFVERIKKLLVDAPDHMTFSLLSCFFQNAMALVEEYDRQVLKDKLEIEGAVDEMVAKDKEVHAIGVRYNLTLNQVAGLKEMCEQVNKQFKDTGLVVVPFWFVSQYMEAMDKINALNIEAENLIETIERMQRTNGLAIPLAQRTSIITGHTSPYIPGETGPRVGDEHLDSGFDAHLFRN